MRMAPSRETRTAIMIFGLSVGGETVGGEAMRGWEVWKCSLREGWAQL